MIGICKLCAQQKKFVQAHIIPDWAFRYLKQDNHLYSVNHKAEFQKIQTGYWDKSMLCSECDNRIGEYDRYAKTFFERDFSKSVLVDEKTGQSAEYIHVRDFDFKKLWLFVVSVLWRASVSTRREFSSVALGPYEPKIREIIMGSAFTDEDEKLIQIVLVKPDADEKGKYDKGVLTPVRRRFGRAICYSFVMAGFEIVAKISKESSPLHVPEFVAQEAGFNVIVTAFDEASFGKYVAHMKTKIRGNDSFTDLARG